MKRSLQIVAAGLLACLPAAAQTQQPIRVKCGGPSYTDSHGQVWQADYGFNTGVASTNGATTVGTSDPRLYRTNRWSGDPLIYTFPVGNGAYRVNLLFAENSEPQQAVGARIFNVRLNGKVVLRNFDIFSTVGADTALVESFNTDVGNGQMVIEFDRIVQNSKINAIEILPLGNAPSLTLKFSYPDGTPVRGRLNYAMSTSSFSIGGNLPLANGQATCPLVASPALLGLVGQTQVALNLTDSAGNMVWQISMGVNPADADLSAVQDSTLQVVLHKP